MSLAGIALVAWRAAYHDWPWQGDPARVSWHGRHYDAQPRLLDAHVLDGCVVSTAFRVPPVLGRRMLTAFPSSASAPGRVCVGGLLLERGGRYRRYELSGGP